MKLTDERIFYVFLSCVAIRLQDRITYKIVSSADDDWFENGIEGKSMINERQQHIFFQPKNSDNLIQDNIFHSDHFSLIFLYYYNTKSLENGFDKLIRDQTIKIESDKINCTKNHYFCNKASKKMSQIILVYFDTKLESKGKIISSLSSGSVEKWMLTIILLFKQKYIETLEDFYYLISLKGNKLMYPDNYNVLLYLQIDNPSLVTETEHFGLLKPDKELNLFLENNNLLFKSSILFLDDSYIPNFMDFLTNFIGIFLFIKFLIENFESKVNKRKFLKLLFEKIYRFKKILFLIIFIYLNNSSMSINEEANNYDKYFSISIFFLFMFHFTILTIDQVILESFCIQTIIIILNNHELYRELILYLNIITFCCFLYCYSLLCSVCSINLYKCRKMIYSNLKREEAFYHLFGTFENLPYHCLPKQDLYKLIDEETPQKILSLYENQLNKTASILKLIRKHAKPVNILTNFSNSPLSIIKFCLIEKNCTDICEICREDLNANSYHFLCGHKYHRKCIHDCSRDKCYSCVICQSPLFLEI